MVAKATKASRPRRARPRRAAPPPPWPPFWLPLALCAALVVAVAGIRATVLLPDAVVARPALSYEAANGRTYAYPLGNDSYGWLRMARNQVESGTPCDSVTEMGCRDDLVAPAGRPMTYAESWHIQAIAWVHRAADWLAPGIPLTASGVWLQVIVAALAVPAAFFIGWRLGGTPGAVGAAVLGNASLYVLMRSQNADNDAWNVALPIVVCACLVASLTAGRLAARIGASFAAAAAVCWHAAIWSGWLFMFAVATVGLCGALGIAAARAFATAWPRRPALGGSVAGLAASVAILLGVVVATQDLGAFSVDLPVVRSFFAPAAAPLADAQSAVRASFGSPLGDVQEYQSASAQQMVDDLGGPVWSWGAWVGLLVLAVWFCDPPRMRFAAIGVGALYYGGLLWVPEALASAGLVVWTLPVLLGLGWATFRSRATVGELGVVLLLAVWMGAALRMSFEAARFLLLYAPVLGIVAGAAGGRLLEQARLRISASGSRNVGWLTTAIVLLLATWPMLRAQTYAERRVPAMNDAWYQATTWLADKASPDAIVHTWWQHGYWVQYFSRARVLADGASVNTQIPYWQAQALLAPDEATSVGLMRALSCASEVRAPPPGVLSALDRLTAHGLDEMQAVRTIVELAPLDRQAARRILSERGFAPEAIRDVLSATHCDPADSYLLLSDAFILYRDLRRLGRWDVGRATLAYDVRWWPEAEAVDHLVGSFGYERDEARSSWREANELTSAEDYERFIGTPDVIVAPWLPCRLLTTGRMECAIERMSFDRETVLRSFAFPVDDPARGVLNVGRLGRPGSFRDATPGSIVLATRSGLVEKRTAASDLEDHAVLVDQGGSRVLVGPRYLVRSTLARLLYLQGRYEKQIRKVGQWEVPSEVVTAWRVNW